MYRILMCVFSPQIYHELHHGFLEAGCEVRNLFIGEELTNKFDLLETRLSQAIDEFKPDFVYSYGWWKDVIDIDVFLDIIKSKGLFHIWWSAVWMAKEKILIAYDEAELSAAAYQTVSLGVHCCQSGPDCPGI